MDHYAYGEMSDRYSPAVMCSMTPHEQSYQEPLISKNTLHWAQMANRILKFMISHLRLVSSGQQDFKVCDQPIETGLKWLTGF